MFAGPYIVWMLIFIFSPMLLIFYYAFTGDGGFTLDNLIAAAELGNLRVLLDSIRLALYTTVLCLVIGYPVAYLLSRMKKATATLLSVFFIVPMWMNFLLRTYAWKVLLGAFSNILYTEGAVLLGMVYNFLPFMILPIYTVLKKLDTRVVEAAEDLGANPLRVFFRVTLPLSMPGVVSGVTMVFMPAATTFAISRLLGSGMFWLMGDLIDYQFREISMASGQNFGSALSLIMMVLIIISIGLLRRFDPKGEGGGVW